MKNNDNVGTLPVVIVGAGLAGLTCALTLNESNIPFLVLEATERAGGRIKTDHLDGFLLDHGFQVILSSYPKASERLNFSELQLKRFYSGALVRHNHQFHLMGDPIKSPQDSLKTLQSKIGTLKDKSLIAKLILETRQQEFQEKGQSTLEFLKAYGFSDFFIQTFFRPFFGGVFLESDLKTAARKFYFLFDLFSRGSAAVPEKGMEAIPKQLVEKLPVSNIRYQQEVVSVNQGSVTLASGEIIQAKAIVVATDPYSARQLIPHLELPDSYSVTCHYFSAPKSPLSKPILVLNGDQAGPINNLAVMSDIAPGYAPPNQSLISVTSLGITDASEEGEVVKQLKDWFGEQVNDWKLLKTYPIRYALPQTLPSDTPPFENPVSPGIYLCGDYMELASIEGAVISGEKVANAIIDKRNL